MKNIKEHIKSNQFSSVYLIFGQESYLKRFYRNRLRDAVLGDGDPMNVSCFQGKDINVREVMEIADTLPFFSEHRVVVVEDSGWFHTQSDMADYIPEIPESTVLIFVESEVDKRNRLYKAVVKYGTVAEMNTPEEQELKLWAASRFKQAGKKITEHTLLFLFERVGTDMENLEHEIEKLICYAYDREIITEDDVQEICVQQITGKVFQMMEAIGMKKQDQAFQYYYDLLALRENPMSILFLIIRQFNLLLQIKEYSRLKQDNKTIAAGLGIPPFAVSKYLAQAKNFPLETLKSAVEYGVQLEEEIKTGRITDRIAVELLIVRSVLG